LARTIYPNGNPVGKRIRFSLFDQPVEVIGVVGHVKQWGLDADATAEIRSQLYMPTMQLPDNIAHLAENGVIVVVRTVAPVAEVLGSIRKVISALDSSQAINEEQAMDQVIANSLASRRFSLTVIAIFAGVAFALSVVGMFGVISYLVRQRTHEIGVRMALGAEAKHIRWSVVGEGGQLAILGIGLGLVASLGLTRLIAGFLFGVTPTDVFTFASVSALLLGVTLVACYIPARRATRVDPMVALRCE
jgi:ABC-type antimicrobial peptide transport system permease subunit